MANTSKSHYVGSNPRGAVDRDTASAVFVLVGVFVFLRLWGRFKYQSPGSRSWPQFGESRFWILMSDLTILLSFLSGLALTIIIDNAVAWGFGIHIKQLSITQIHRVMEMFFMFQIFYKWTAGISKVASCFLFLAIATPQMTRFKTACYVLIVYQGLLSLFAAVATVFQCGLDIESNYIMTNRQTHCFPKPPFWYAHGALTIVSSIGMVTLPLWLFSHITYKRKWSIAGIMTALATTELILSCVRLKGLVETAHNLTDIPYSATTGLLISTLEVDFGIVAACIPTISKLLDEYMSRMFYCVTGRERPTKSDGYSKSTSRTPKGTIHLETLSNSMQASKYTQFGVEIDSISMGSQGNHDSKFSATANVTTITAGKDDKSRRESYHG